MANTFLISKANPIPFRKLVEIDIRYNSIPFDLRPTEKSVNGCYYQKWEITDSTTVQLLSDYTSEANGLICKVYNAYSKEVFNIVPVVVPTNIVNQTFKAYELEFDFSDYGNGYFYAEISYTDEDDNDIVYQSQGWQVATKWPETLLFEYKNSFNNYSVVFDTGIEFNYRIEGKIINYTPQFDDEIYIDQIHNATQLSATPFNQFQLITHLLPDWALQILNYVLNCDEKKIDGDYYEKTDNAKFELTRTEGNPYASAVIDLTLIEDFFLQRLITDDMADGVYQVNTRWQKYENNAINRSMVGIFRKATNLRRIDLLNKDFSSFTFRVGTTDGGNEIAELEVTSDQQKYSWQINELFDSQETVYLTGISTSINDIYVVFDQDDEDAINISTGTNFRFPAGYWGYWAPLRSSDMSISDQVSAIWDLGSGLGKAGTKYENCAICDGRNGTENELGAFATALASFDIVDINAMQLAIGDNEKPIPKSALPNEGVGLFASYTQIDSNQVPTSTDKVARALNQPGQQLSYVIVKAPNSITNIAGVSFPLGDGDDFDVRPKSFPKIPFLAITD